MKSNKEGKPLSVEFLTEHKFEREEFEDDDGDKVVVWIKNGISVYEDDNKEYPFAFATYVKGDGSFKGGFIVYTETHLQNIYYALSSKILDTELE